MLGPKHYVPILRWKRGEKIALARVLPEDRARITPLIEITRKIFEAPKNGKKKGMKPSPAEVLSQQIEHVLEHWGMSPFFLDLWHIDGQVSLAGGVAHPLTHAADAARTAGLQLVPVTALARSRAFQSTVSQICRTDGRGLCLRLLACEIVQPSFSGKLEALIRGLGRKESETDLMLDCQVLDIQSPSLPVLLARIPRLNLWRSLIVTAGAFPPDLQKFKPGSHVIPRSEWLAWKHYSSNGKRPSRQSTFSDYTIQYGLYREPVDNCNPSASIRYTVGDDWLIMRGEGIRNKNGPGRAQWTANAILLRDRPDFYGRDFSYGDNFIFEKSYDPDNHGSPEGWIRAGINHHLTVVSREIASLP